MFKILNNLIHERFNERREYTSLNRCREFREEQKKSDRRSKDVFLADPSLPHSDVRDY